MIQQHTHPLKRLSSFRCILRLAVYLAGIVLLALGITLNTKTLLGVSPIISIPYNISIITGAALGFVTFLFYCALILLQLILLRRDFHPVQFLQIIMSLLTSLFIQIFDDILPSASSVPARLFLLLLAVVITGIGAGLTVGMKIIPNPADGMADTIGKKCRKNLGFGKNCFDFISLGVSCLIGLLFCGRIVGIGIGTILSMLLTGRVIALFQKHIDRLYAYTAASAREAKD